MGRYSFILLVSWTLLSACVRDVEIDLEELPDRIVLNMSVSPGKEVRAHLSKTWFIMDSIPDFELSGAKVRVYVNDGFRGIMREDDQPGDSLSLPGQYVLPGCLVRQGDRLRVEAEAQGYEPVSGETRIPPAARIHGVDTLSYLTLPYHEAYIRFSVGIEPNEACYYRLIVERVIDFRKGDSVRTVTSFHAPGRGYGYYSGFDLNYEDPVFQPLGGSPLMGQVDGKYCMGVFTGKDLSGANVVRVSVSSLAYSYESDTLSSEVHYDIRLLSISEDYYRYMKIMRGYSITIGDADFGALIEPSDTYTNVRNGFGIVAGYQEDRWRITMQKDTVPPLWNPWDGYRY